jgi:pyrimidine operon attenuation protein / uracil phosphoribosyltransferase
MCPVPGASPAGAERGARPAGGARSARAAGTSGHANLTGGVRQAHGTSAAGTTHSAASAGGSGGPSPAAGAAAAGSGAAKQVLERADIGRALTRIAHEIIERTKGAGDVVLLGIQTRGVPLAYRLAERIAQVEGRPVLAGSLDITMYRDDLRLRPARALGRTHVPAEGIDGRTVVLVDDVLYSGRTVRAALDALNDIGRPRAVQLAILIDRGHRELPVRADYVGKNLPTAQHEVVRVLLDETDGEDVVVLGPGGPDAAPRSGVAGGHPGGRPRGSAGGGPRGGRGGGAGTAPDEKAPGDKGRGAGSAQSGGGQS